MGRPFSFFNLVRYWGSSLSRFVSSAIPHQK
jgi:hypothetical protein